MALKRGRWRFSVEARLFTIARENVADGTTPADRRARDYPLRPWPGHHGFASSFRPDWGGACTNTSTQRWAIVRRGRGLRAASGREGRESIQLEAGSQYGEAAVFLGKLSAIVDS